MWVYCPRLVRETDKFWSFAILTNGAEKLVKKCYIVLLPDLQNCVKLEWVGPFEVAKRISEVDYEVGTPGQKDAKKVPCELAEEAAAAAFLALTEVRAGEWTESDLYGKALSHLKGQRRKHQMGCIFQLRLSMRVWKGYCRSFQLFSKQPEKTSLVSHTIHAERGAPIRQRAYLAIYSQ